MAKTTSKNNKSTKRLPKLQELIGLLIIFSSGFLLLSLFHHHPQDSKLLFYPPTNHPMNPSGKYGAIISSYLFHWFGYLSYGIGFGALVLGILIFFRVQVQEILRKTSAFLMLFLAALTLAAFLTSPEFSSTKMPSYGGIYGEFVKRIITPRVGKAGTLLLITLTTITGLVVGTDILFSSIVKKLGAWLAQVTSSGSKLGKSLGSVLLDLGKGSLTQLKKFGVLLKDGLSALAISLGQGLKSAGQFIWNTVRPSESDTTEEPSSKWEQERADDAVNIPSQSPSPETEKTPSTSRSSSVTTDSEATTSTAPSQNNATSAPGSSKTQSSSASTDTTTTSSSSSSSSSTSPSSSSQSDTQTKDSPSHSTTSTRHGEQSYELPPISLLDDPEDQSASQQKRQMKENRKIIEQTLDNFDINARITNCERGASVTTYELELAPGEKVKSIMRRSEDLQVSLGQHIRIVSPLPGKSSRIGIEVPNQDQQLIRLKTLWKEGKQKAQSSRIPLFLGRNSGGDSQIIDLAEMPHLLLAGTTGSGKSVCLKNLVANQLMQHSPMDLKLVLIDPKLVEFSIFRDIPHLICPIITDMKKVLKLLDWLVQEMEERYELFQHTGCRSIDDYRELSEEEIKERLDTHGEDPEEAYRETMPRIMMVIDELADLMMVSSKEVESAITRIAQKARAVGIHMLLATQRPSNNVITGMIKSNMPARISFKVMSKVDSRIILDQNGAENLIGDGDMLVQLPDREQPIRTQGTFITDEEVRKICNHWKEEIRKFQSDDQQETTEEDLPTEEHSDDSRESSDLSDSESSDEPTMPGQQVDLDQLVKQDDRDDLFEDAVDIVVQTDRGSVSLLQRKLEIGYTRAARIVDQMEEAGIVGPHRGSKARKVLISQDEWEEQKEAVIS